MTITTASQMLDPQILVDAVRGRLAQKNAFMGSVLVSGGAVMVSGTMPEGGPNAIGNTITVPYFGTIGEFANNPDGSSVTPSQLAQTSETATVSRDSLAAELSIWAQGIGAANTLLGDPYDEASRQIEVAATRAMDRAIMTAASGTPLVNDVYSATTPVYISHDLAIDSRAKWGDEQDDIVAMAVHSRTHTDMAKLKDADGRPLLISQQTEGQGQVTRFAGMPVVVSDLLPLTGSTMGTVTSAGTSPPVATLAGTPTGPWDLRIDCILGGAHTTATYRFSTDGGQTWSATITTLGVGVAQNLTDTATDSLVGNNGATGLTVAFAAGTFNADNTWSATANLKVMSLGFQRDACAFWYNAARLGMRTDVDILADTDILAMHLYRVAHMYRRRRGGTKPGVFSMQHNVRNYIG